MSSPVEVTSSTQAENGVCEKDPSKTMLSFSPSFQLKHCGVMSRFRKKRSNQQGKAVTHLFRSSLFKVVSTLGR